MTIQQEPPLPTKELGVIWLATLPPGFLGVMACLQRPQLMEGICKAPPDPLTIEVISAPAVAMVSASHIVRAKVTGATYMDAMTTLVGWVALSGPKLETSAQEPTIQDVMDLV